MTLAFSFTCQKRLVNRASAIEPLKKEEEGDEDGKSCLPMKRKHDWAKLKSWRTGNSSDSFNQNIMNGTISNCNSLWAIDKSTSDKFAALSWQIPIRMSRTWVKLKIDANSLRHGNGGNLIFKSVPPNRSSKNNKKNSHRMNEWKKCQNWRKHLRERIRQHAVS